MNKAAAIGIAAVVGVAGAAAGAMAWTGGRALDELRAQTHAITKLSPAFQVVDEKLERGLMHSSYEVKLRFGCLPALPDVPGVPALPAAAGEPIELGVRTEVRHGPLLPSGLGVAQLDTVVLVPEGWKTRVEALTAHQPPLRVVSTIAFDRSFDAMLTMPALKFSDPEAGSFETDALRATLHGSSWDAAQGARYDFEVPGWALHARAPDTTLDVGVGPVHSETTVGVRKDPSRWLFDSQSTGSLTNLTIQTSAPNAIAGTPTPLKASFAALKFEAKTKLDRGLYNSELSYSGAGRFNDFNIDKVELKAGIRRLEVASYQRLLQHVLENTLSCDPKLREGGLAAQFPVLERDAVALLMGDPEYGLDTLAVEIGGQRGELSYAIGSQGVKSADADRALLDLALEHGFVRAHVKVQLGLLDAIDRQLAPSTPAGEPGTLRTMADFALTQFGSAGFIVQNGDALESALDYRSGQLQVNGKTPVLPDLDSLLGGK